MMSEDMSKKVKMRTTALVLNDNAVLVLATIKGLTRERALVRNAFMDMDPDAVAIHISAEEMIGLKKVVDGKIKEIALSNYEEVYAKKLSRYGQVQVPPPSIVSAYRLAKKKKIPILALDVGEERFTEAFTSNISTMQLYRHSSRLKKLAKKKYSSSDPEQFIREWDADVTKLKGFSQLEDIRERHMAERIQYFSGKFDTLLAVVEFERAPGILRHLEN